MIGLDEGDRASTIRLITDSAAFMAMPAQVARSRTLRWETPGFDRTVWSQAAELGWLGLRVSEERGGVGLGVQELCALAEMLGRGLAPEPLVPAIAIAPLLDDDCLAQVIAGERVVLPAWQNARQSGPAVLTGGRLSGRKVFVHMANGADELLVPTEDALTLVDVRAKGVSIETAMLQDGGHFGTVIFDDVPVTTLSGSMQAAIEEMSISTAAYLLGTMRQAFEITIDYLRTRRQFDRFIGSFQALQHRAVDLYIQIELAAASISDAAAMLEQDPSSSATARAVSRATARASDAAMLVTKQGIQLHGGIGFTDDADIGLFLRKALTLSNLHGSSADHRDRYARLYRASPLDQTQ